MDFTALILFSLIVPIIVLLGIIIVKMIRGRAIPNSDYTPFDYIMGQSPVEFHEEKEVKEQKNDQGDDKEKKRKRGL